MTEAFPTRKLARRREPQTRKDIRQQERHVANATLRAAVKAIGGGEAGDWNEDGLEGEWAASGENGGQGDE